MHFVPLVHKHPRSRLHVVFEHDVKTHIVRDLVASIALCEAVRHDADVSHTAGDGLGSDDELLSIMHQLKQLVAEPVQELGRHCPPKYPPFGAWPEGPFRNCYTDDGAPVGPFETVDGFHEHVLDRMRPRFLHHETYEDLERVRCEEVDHAPVLPHGDLAPRNILNKGGRIAGVVDWEIFGWYPDCWGQISIGNQMTARRTYEAINTVFGETPLACQTYRYVDAYLSSPF